MVEKGTRGKLKPWEVVFGASLLAWGCEIIEFAVHVQDAASTMFNHYLKRIPPQGLEAISPELGGRLVSDVLFMVPPALIGLAAWGIGRKNKA